MNLNTPQPYFAVRFVDQVLPLNPSLEKAQSFGMKFHFLDRSTYKMKDQIDLDGA